MKPATHTLKSLFESDVRYVVPLYQRPYVWTKDKHWEPLWGDIQDVLDHYLSHDLESSEAMSHFLGALVLDQEVDAAGPLRRAAGNRWPAALNNTSAAACRGNKELAGCRPGEGGRLLKALIQNNPDLEEGDGLFKVWPTNANREAFRIAMNTDGIGGENDPDNSIQEAAIYFQEAIDEWVSDDNPADDEKGVRYEALRVALTDLLNIVSINLEEGDNAQVIFETLNARGTPLLAMDLVKNAVFHRASKEGIDVDQLHEKVWLPELGADYWREEQRQGRLTRPRAELFLMHWLAVELGRIMPATELFTQFRTHILDAPEKPRMDELIRRSTRTLRSTASSTSNPREPWRSSSSDTLTRWTRQR